MNLSQSPDPQKPAASNLGSLNVPAATSHQVTSGDRMLLGGKPYNVVVLTGQDTALEDVAGLTPEDRRALDRSLEALRHSAQTVQRMSDRLLDRADGLTLAGATALAECLPLLSGNRAMDLSHYLLGLMKNGSTLHSTRGSVIAPPIPRDEMEALVASLPADTRAKVDFDAWVSVVYDHVPLATEGFYLFETPGDRQRFEQSLGAPYWTLRDRVSALFDKATRGGLDDSEMTEYDRGSQELMELQKQALEPALAANADARAMSTRVRILVDPTGSVSLVSTHFTEEFAADLAILRTQLLDAASALPARCAELREVLEAQADWCVDNRRDPEWGQSVARWVSAKDPSSVIDVNVTCEEKASHIGAKGNFHILVTQHVEIPENLRDVWKTVQDSAQKSNVNTLLLKILLAGGHASNYTISGEKLPDPANQPEYKSMTFQNTTQAMMLTAQADAIAAATGREKSEILAMSSVPVLAVALHEFGHTLGDHAAFLGEHAGSVEETNAQGSAIYLTARLAPDRIEDMLTLEACWMPVRRVRQGPTEQHSRSDIVLFEEYLGSGSIRLEQSNGKEVVRVADPVLATERAFATAIKMRLWERGIPERCHASIAEPFDRSDSDQDARIASRADAWVASQADMSQLRAETCAEVNAFFSNKRLLSIGDKLANVIAHMPPEQPLPIIPTDERFSLLVRA